MTPPLETDLRNIADWSEACARHHGHGAFRESLMHARLVGEAATRVIIRMAWSGRRGEEGAAEPSYDLRLRLIQGRVLAPPAIVSALHVLRTRGNNALHGHPVSANLSAGALFMLHALVDHLYVELLGRPVPEPVAVAMDQALGGHSASKGEEVLRAVIEEERVIELPSATSSPEAVDISHIEAEQELHRARLRDMEETLRRLIVRETPDQSTPVAEAVFAPVEEPPKAGPRTRWFIALPVLVLVFAAVWFLVGRTSTPLAGDAVPKADSTITTVLILPFAVMQDDPNLNLRFEQAIADRMNARIRAAQLALRVFVADTAFAALPVEDSVLAIGQRVHADLIFYGELFEPTIADSGRVHIRFVARGAEQWPRGDLGARAFRTLADSASVRTQLAVSGIAELALANRLYGAGKPSAALALLYNAPKVDKDWTVTNHLLRARCHRLMEDLGPAMRELEAGMKLDPDNAATLGYMARVLKENGNINAAIEFYGKAVAREPDNAGWLLQLAYLHGDASRPEHFNKEKVRDFSARALAAGEHLAPAWELHGWILAQDGRLPEARAAYERAIALDSLHVAAHYGLAMVVYQTTPRDHALVEAHLRTAVRLDSSDTRQSLMLARVLTEGPNKDPVLADRLYRRAKATDPRLELQALAGRAKAATEAGDMQQALQLYQELWSKDSSDVAVGVRIAVRLGNAGRREESIAMLLRCLALDSLHHGVNLNLGTAPERKKTLLHLERALATDPYDVYTLERMGMALAEDAQYAKAVPVLERVLNIEPRSHLGNGYLGSVLTQLGRFTEAIGYYEKALITDPADPVVCGGLAALYSVQKPPRHGDARILLQRALKDLPDDPELNMSLCTVLMAEQDFQRAATHYQRAIATQPRYRNASVEKRLQEQGAM